MPLADDAWPRPQRRSRLCAMAGDADVSFGVAPLHDASTLSLEGTPPSTGGPRRCAEFWPDQAGWYRVRLYNGDTDELQDESYFYVFADHQWRAHRRYERQQATLMRASQNAADEAEMNRTVGVDVPPLWPWLIFMLSAGLLWLERRLHG